MTMLSRAIRFAVDKHDGKHDKAGEPYILHVLTVMALTGSSDETVRAAAVLHDVVEDTDATWQDLEDIGMTNEVIDIVRAVTKQRGQTYAQYQDAVFANAKAMIVKLADLQHNSDVRRLKGVTERDIARTVQYVQFAHAIQERLKAL
jgi:(p)ppGpp synthase/HD superfamily hydrolase